MSVKDLQRRDLARIWHPCSQMKDYEAHPPFVVDRGEGVWLYDVEGRRCLDAVSSWWVNLFGHNNDRLNGALRRQAEKLAHCIFSDFSHGPAIELAERIVTLAPPGLERVFFADNGSAAVEVALKMSFQYHRLRGDAGRKTFLSFSDGYHGETLGALAVGGLGLYGAVFSPLMMETLKVPSPDCFRCPYGRKREACDVPCFEAMERCLAERGRESCAVIVEPLLQGAAGMKVYPPAYLAKLRRACDEAGAHLIADEIAVGMGRSGTFFACEQAAVTPDFLLVSKGITGGYLPLSLVVTTEEVYRAFYGDYNEGRAFLHSHSYTGNALACAVACETLNLFDEGILEVNRVRGAFIEEAVRSRFEGHRHVGEIRRLGMVTAVELVEGPGGKAFDRSCRVGHSVYRRALERGVLLRPLGDVLYFMPPYVISDEEVLFMAGRAGEALEATL